MNKYQLPWKEPISCYDDDGPEEPTTFEVAGVKLRVEFADSLGMTSLRGRYRVECLTCGVVIHPATTGATIRCEEHLRDHEEGTISEFAYPRIGLEADKAEDPRRR